MRGLGQYHDCWCPGSLRRQDISSHDTDYVESAGPCLTQGGISITCVSLMWRNDIKCKYMFMLSLKKLARKGLKSTAPHSPWSTSHVIQRVFNFSSKNSMPSCPASSGMYSMIARRTRHLVSSANSTMAGRRLCESCLIPITCGNKIAVIFDPCYALI